MTRHWGQPTPAPWSHLVTHWGASPAQPLGGDMFLSILSHLGGRWVERAPLIPIGIRGCGYLLRIQIMGRQQRERGRREVWRVTDPKLP